MPGKLSPYEQALRIAQGKIIEDCKQKHRNATKKRQRMCINTTKITNIVNDKMIPLKLSCCNFGDLGVFFVLFSFSFPSYLVVVFILMLNGRRVDTALCSLRYRFGSVVA